MKFALLLDAATVTLCLVGGLGDSSPIIVEDFYERRSAGSGSLVVVEDIQRRVKVAGGNVEGIIVASLAWSSADDLDLHVKTPAGTEISYANKRAAGGELDVDMCVHGRHSGKCTENPVENVVFSDEAAQGRYEVYVQNFAYHPDVRSREVQVSSVLEGKKPSKGNKDLRFGSNRMVPFEVLVKVEGIHRLFSGICTLQGKTHTASNIKVFEFEYFPNALTDEARVMPIFEHRSDPTCVAFKAQLLGGPEERSFIDNGGNKGHDHAGQLEANEDGLTHAPRKTKAPSPPRRKASNHARKWEQAKAAALETVRSSSRDSLLAKPPKMLRELLTDLGTTCRGCLDKSEIVDRLREVAGVPRSNDEL